MSKDLSELNKQLDKLKKDNEKLETMRNTLEAEVTHYYVTVYQCNVCYFWLPMHVHVFL